MSTLRSRNGGSLIWTTFSRKYRSCRNFPSLTTASRSRFVAAMTRALDRPEAYYWLGYLSEAQGDQKQAIRYYYMAVTARSDYAPAVEALKRSGKLH